MHMTKELERVLTLARRRGAQVRVATAAAIEDVRHDRRRLEGWHDSPFSHFQLGIDARTRTVWLVDTAAKEPEAAGSIIHELGHLHAMPNEAIERAREWAWMGWELAVAREAKVRRAWDYAMRDYGVGDPCADDCVGLDWSALERYQQLHVMRDRLAFAQTQGIVDARGRAVWSRLA